MPLNSASPWAERHAPPGAPKQLHADQLLQRRDLASYGALRHGEFIAGEREALVPRRCFESEEGGGGAGRGHSFEVAPEKWSS